MKPDVSRHVAAVRAALERHGLLLSHDARLPSVTAIVAGEAVKGSWWGHARGNEIFHTLGQIEDEVGWAKLLAGKVTLVHRRLWPALLGVATSGAEWQSEGLAKDAAALAARVKKEGSVRAEDLDRAQRKHVADLEKRLLVSTRDEHTESGHHTRILEPWSAWAKSHGVKEALGEREARAALETAAKSLGAAFRLPWP